MQPLYERPAPWLTVFERKKPHRELAMESRKEVAEHAAFLDSLPLKQAHVVVTTLPEWEANRALLHALHVARYRGRIAGVVRDDLHAGAPARGHQQDTEPLLSTRPTWRRTS